MTLPILTTITLWGLKIWGRAGSSANFDINNSVMGDFLTKQGLRWGGEAGETGAEAVITRNPCRDWVISETLPEFCLASTLNRSQVSSRMSTSCPLAPCSSCQAGDQDTHNQMACRVQSRWFVEEKRPMSAHTGPSALKTPTGFNTGGQHSCVNHTVRLDANRPHLSRFLWLCGFGQFMSPHWASISPAVEWVP